MDEERKSNDASSDVESKSEPATGPRVEIFGEDVSGWRARRKEWREDWKKNRENIRRERREARDRWRSEYGDQHCHQGGGGFWGIAFLFLGVVLLLDTFHLIAPEFWHAIAPFWPVLLILWGVHIILGHSWFGRFITFLVTIVAVGFIVAYGLVRIGSPLANEFPPNVVSGVNQMNPNPIINNP